MKNIVRVICLLLACLFCLLAVAACDKEKKKKGNSNVNVKVDENGVRWAEDEWGTWREYDNLPDELDYGGEAVTLLHWEKKALRPEFKQEEEVDLDVESSIYKRNMEIEGRLNVDLVFSSAGEDSGRDVFVSKVQTAVESNMNDFDLLAGEGLSIGKLAVMGYTVNLAGIEDSHIELSKPWWPSNITGNLDIGGNLYFITGDMSTNTIFQMQAFFLNKKIANADLQTEATKYFNENPHVKTAANPSKDNPEGGDTASNMIYEMIYAGKWTLDEFIRLTSGKYVDKTSNGLSGDDKFGFTSIDYCMCAFYTGANLRLLEPTTDGSILKVSDDWQSTKTVKLISKLNGLLSTNDFHNTDKTGTAYMKPFTEGNCMISLYFMRYAMDELANSSKVPQYGILPTPKWDTQQKNYYTMLGNDITLYAIFSDFDPRGDEQGTLSMLSAVIECWGSEAFRKTTPVIFELSMKLKASPTQCEADMCEIVRCSIELDLGRIIRAALADDPSGSYAMDNSVVACAIKGIPWSTVVNKDLERIKTNLADFMEVVRNTGVS